MTFVAGFTIGGEVGAVDGSCEDTGGCGFANATWSAEEEGVV